MGQEKKIFFFKVREKSGIFDLSWVKSIYFVKSVKSQGISYQVFSLLTVLAEKIFSSRHIESVFCLQRAIIPLQNTNFVGDTANIQFIKIIIPLF